MFKAVGRALGSAVKRSATETDLISKKSASLKIFGKLCSI
jgi:hypothetical protein